MGGREGSSCLRLTGQGFSPSSNAKCKTGQSVSVSGLQSVCQPAPPRANHVCFTKGLAHLWQREPSLKRHHSWRTALLWTDLPRHKGERTARGPRAPLQCQPEQPFPGEATAARQGVSSAWAVCIICCWGALPHHPHLTSCLQATGGTISVLLQRGSAAPEGQHGDLSH